MGIEKERKFEVKNDDWKQLIHTSRKFCYQGYLSFDPERSVRVRTMGDQGFITVKGLRQNGENEEFEAKITYEEAQRMLNRLCFKPLLEKTRYVFPYNDGFINYKNEHGFVRYPAVWEIDVYEGKYEGLVVAEIELPGMDVELELPSWIGKERTDDTAFLNVVMAQALAEEWFDDEGFPTK